jgi:hypothetical protein
MWNIHSQPKYIGDMAGLPVEHSGSSGFDSWLRDGCHIDVCVQCSSVPSIDHNQFLLFPFQLTVITLSLNAIHMIIVDQELVADVIMVL